MTLSPRALFLDVGETLVYPHPSSAEVIAAACRGAGLDISPEQVSAAEAAISPRMAQRQTAGGELYSISMENSRRFWTWVYSQLLDELGVPEAHHQPLGELLHTHFNSLHSWHLYPDSLPTLEALQPRRRAGMKLAIISNWEDWLQTLLTHLDLDRYFDFAVISATERVEKPDPAIFRAALERAGAPASAALHVGDSVHADVEGAAAVGITPVLLDRRRRYAQHQSSLPETTQVVTSLDQVLGLLG